MQLISELVMSYVYVKLYSEYTEWQDSENNEFSSW